MEVETNPPRRAAHSDPSCRHGPVATPKTRAALLLLVGSALGPKESSREATQYASAFDTIRTRVFLDFQGLQSKQRRRFTKISIASTGSLGQ